LILLKACSKILGCEAQTSARGGVVKTTPHKEAMFATKQTGFFQQAVGGL